MIMQEQLEIRKASKEDVPLILKMIKDLAEYEKLLHEVTATQEILMETLFGDTPRAEVVLGYFNEKPVAFALYFYNFSTFLGKPGIYLEDLYVVPSARGKGFGKNMLAYLAKLAVAKDCGRLEWWVLDWNKSAIGFYESIGAKAMDEWTVYRVSGGELRKLSDEYSDIV